MRTTRVAMKTMIGNGCLVAGAACAILALLPGCELLVDFDRNKIPDASVAPSGDAMAIDSGALAEGSLPDASDDGGDATVAQAPDASDAGASAEAAPDSGQDDGSGEAPDSGADAGDGSANAGDAQDASDAQDAGDGQDMSDAQDASDDDGSDDAGDGT